MASAAARKRSVKDGGEAPASRLPEEIKRPKTDEDSQDELGDALSSDIKGLLRAIESVKEKSQETSRKVSTERLASLSNGLKNDVEAAKARVEKEGATLRKCVETTQHYEAKLNEVTDSFEKEAKRFKASCEKYQKERESIFDEYERFKEKLERKIEQQRRKDKAEYTSLQKKCTEKLQEAEEILAKQKKEAKSISVLRKSLGTILEDSGEGLDDADFEE